MSTADVLIMTERHLPVKKSLMQSIESIIRPERYIRARFEEAVTQQAKNNVGEAKSLFMKVAKTRAKSVRPSATKIPYYIEANFRLGRLYKAEQKYDKAYEFLSKAYNQCKKVSNLFPPATEYVEFEIGVVAYQANEYTCAIRFLMDARQSDDTTSGKDNKNIVDIIFMLGKAYYMCGDFDQAAVAFKRTLDLIMTRNPHGELLSLSQAWLGCAHYNQGEMDSAWIALEGVDSCRGRIYNPQSKEQWPIRRWRAKTAYEQGFYNEARDCYIKDIYEAISSIDTTNAGDDLLRCKQYLTGLLDEIKKLWDSARIPHWLRKDFKGQLRNVRTHEPFVKGKLETFAIDLDNIDAKYDVGPDLQDPWANTSLLSVATADLPAPWSPTALDTDPQQIGTPMTIESIKIQLSTTESEQLAFRLKDRLYSLPSEGIASTSHDSTKELLHASPVEKAHYLISNHEGQFQDSELAEIGLWLQSEDSRGHSLLRMYIILYKIGIPNALSIFTNKGLDDYHIPLRTADFDGLDLNAAHIDAFLREQDNLVLKNDAKLETGPTGTHRHFSQTIDIERSNNGYSFVTTIFAHPDGGCIKLHHVKSDVTGKSFAIKQISRALQPSASMEIESLKHVCHKHGTSHIIRFVSSYTDPDWFVLIMDYAQPDLKEYFRLTRSWRNGESIVYPPSWKPSDSDLRKSVGCLATTLTKIHSDGCKHRDLKPANILMDDGRPIFSDWGLAKRYATEDCPSHGTIDGCTDLYAAPEVLEGQERTTTTEDFSFGLIIVDVVLCLKQLPPDWLRREFRKRNPTIDAASADDYEKRRLLPGCDVEFLHECLEKAKTLGQQEDNKLLDWACEMTQKDPGARMTCAQLLLNIDRDTMYLGACCL